MFASLRQMDARYFQIAALCTLLLLSNFWSDFGSGGLAFGLAMAGCLATQSAFAITRNEPLDWRSPLITSCSLALLLRAETVLWFLGAGMLAMAAKAVVRWRGKHFFNPANIAIVALLVGGAPVWISPGQWGQVAWIAALMIAFGALVLGCARRLDIALAFIISHALCLFGRAWWLGDPFTIPLNQLQTGAIIVFTCFMITDPRSTPNARSGRFILAGLVAVTALFLQIRFQLVGAPLYALALLSPLTPLIDRILGGTRFQWRIEGGKHEALA